MAKKKAAAAEGEAATEEKPAKARQQHLDGMAPPSIPEIDTAADVFVDARNAWQKKKDVMVEKKAMLDALMKKHGLTEYEYDGNRIFYDETIKVNRKKGGGEEE